MFEGSLSPFQFIQKWYLIKVGLALPKAFNSRHYKISIFKGYFCFPPPWIRMRKRTPIGWLPFSSLAWRSLEDLISWSARSRSKRLRGWVWKLTAQWSEPYLTRKHWGCLVSRLSQGTLLDSHQRTHAGALPREGESEPEARSGMGPTTKRKSVKYQERMSSMHHRISISWGQSIFQLNSAGCGESLDEGTHVNRHVGCR